MKNQFILFLIITFTFAQSQNKSPLQIGETITLQSKILNQERTINIFLPSNYYTNNQKNYPIIYLLDGSLNEDFLHVCGLVQFFNLQFKMPETILVGISNIDRKHDFTHPTQIEDLKKKFPTTGGSENFISFIENELQPYIKTNYSNSEKKYLIGQSLGGLLAVEILLKKPELFSHYIITSPSLWWDDQSLLKNTPKLLQKLKETKNVYLAVGEEHKIMIRDAKKLFEHFKKNDQFLNSRFHFFSKENHATILHNSLYQAFLDEFPYVEPD